VVLGRGNRLFFYSTASRPALGPTQPRIQWEPGVVHPREKRLGREADHSPTSSAEIKNGESLLRLPICLHSIVRKYIIKYRDKFNLLQRVGQTVYNRMSRVRRWFAVLSCKRLKRQRYPTKISPRTASLRA
jgi:hypothetical protein